MGNICIQKSDILLGFEDFYGMYAEGVKGNDLIEGLNELNSMLKEFAAESNIEEFRNEINQLKEWGQNQEIEILELLLSSSWNFAVEKPNLTLESEPKPETNGEIKKSIIIGGLVPVVPDRPMNFLNRIYLGSDAKNLLQNTFKIMATKRLIVDILEGTSSLPSDLNNSIVKFLEELFNIIKLYAYRYMSNASIFNTPTTDSLFGDKLFGSNLYNIRRALISADPDFDIFNNTMNARDLENLYQHYIEALGNNTIETSKEAQKLLAFNAFVMLYHFDDLLQQELGRWIVPSQNYFNVPQPARVKKYSFSSVEGSNQNESWRDDEKGNNSWDILHDKNRRIIESMPLYKRYNDTWIRTQTYLSQDYINLAILTIKNKLRKLLAKTSTKNNVITIDKNGEVTIFGDSRVDISLATRKVLNYIRVFRGESKAKISLGDIIAFSRIDPKLMYKALFDVIHYTIKSSKQKELELTDQEAEVLYSLYKDMFEEIDENGEKGKSLFNASRDIYNEICSVFDIGTAVENTQYVIRNGHPDVVVMSPINMRRLSGKVQSNINANLIPERLPELTLKYLPFLNLTNPDDPLVIFYIKGVNNNYKIVHHTKLSGNNKTETYISEKANKDFGKISSKNWKRVGTISETSTAYNFIYDIIGKNLNYDIKLEAALRSTLNSGRQGVVNYLLQLAVPSFANAVAFRALDITNRETVTIGRYPQSYNKITDPFSLKVGEIVYKKNSSGKFEEVIVIPDGTKKVSSSLGDTYFVWNIDAESNADTRKIIFNINDKGYRQLRKKRSINTRIDIKDLEVLTISQFRKKILEGTGEYYHSALNYYNLRDLWYGINSKEVKLNKNYGSLDVFTNATYSNLENYLNAIALVEGLTTKSTLKTGEGTDLAIGGTNMLFSERLSFWAIQGLNKDGKYVNPITNLLDIAKDSYGNPIISSYHLSREFVNGPLQKQHKDFNIRESATAAFIYDYIVPLYTSTTGDTSFLKPNKLVRFVEAVVSDKPRVPLIGINRNNVRRLNTKEKVNDAIKYALGNTYAAVFENIEQDCKTLTKYILEEGKDILPDVLDINITILDDYKALNDWAEKHHEWCKQNGITPLKLLLGWVERYNLEHRLNPLTFIEETHYRVSKEEGEIKDHLESVLSFLLLIIRYTDGIQTETFKAHAEVNFNEIATRHFKNKYGDDYEPYLKEWQEQCDYDKFSTTNLNNLLQALLKNNVYIDLKDSSGEVFKWVKAASWNKKEVLKQRHGSEKFYNSDKFAFAVIKDAKNNTLKLITKRYDMYGYTDSEGNQHVFLDNNGKSILDADFDLNTGLYDHNLNTLQTTLVQVEVNPELELFNLHHFYYTLLSVLTTNGSHVWSDAKRDTNSPKEEGAKYFDFNKRNVVNTAANSQFRLGDTKGIPLKLNVAVIDDIKSLCVGINGDEAYVKPYDGMTRIDPFMVHWENNSLNQTVTAATKKPIGYSMLERYMAGFVHKTASFAITNQGMRENFWDRRMMWKMTKPQWMIKNAQSKRGYSYGSSFDVDITKSDVGDINYGSSRKEDQLFYKTNTIDGLKYYRIDKITKQKYIPTDKSTKANTYDILVTRVTEDGEVWVGENGQTEILPITREITSNYALWEVLGGYNSLEFNSNSGLLQDSENSIKKVAEVAGQVKFIELKYTNKTGEEVSLYTLITSNLKDRVDSLAKRGNLTMSLENLNDLKETLSNDELLNSSLFVVTPMKESDIHILATKGSVKKGFGNINSAEKYENNEDLNFMQIIPLDYGIQLDAEHTADKSVVSMMTQVISALADRGYTHNMAQEVYKALSLLTNDAVSEYMGDFESYFKNNDRTQLQHQITNLIVREFMLSTRKTSDTDLARAIMSKLVEANLLGLKLKEEDTLDALPTSDGSIFNLLLSTISAVINKTAIKAQMFGSLAVLCPAHGIQKLIGDKKLTDIKTFDYLKTTQANLENAPLKDVSDIELKRVYLVNFDDGTSKLYRINNMADYYGLKDLLANQKNYSIFEKLYDIEQNETNKLDAKFGWYEITVPKLKKVVDPNTNETKLVLENTSIVINVDANYREALSRYQIDPEKVTSIKKVNLYSRDLAPYNVHVTAADGSKYCLYDLEAVRGKYELETLYKEITSLYKEIKDPKSEIEDIYLGSDIYISKLRKKVTSNLLLENGITSTKVDYIESLLKKYISVSNTNDFSNAIREDVEALKRGVKVKDLNALKLKVSEKIKNYTKELQEQLYYLSLTEKPTSYLEEQKEIKPIKILDSFNNVKEVNISKYNVVPYEALLPRVYAEQFGLRWGDSVSDVSSNMFFFKRAIENYQTSKVNERNYDVSLKLLNGKHVYLKLNSIGQDEANSVLVKLDTMPLLQNGKIYRRNLTTNKPDREISSKNDEFWIDTETNTEITVVKTSQGREDLTLNLKFYLDKIKYLSIELSDELLKNDLNRARVLNAIKSSTNNTAKQFTENFIATQNDEGSEIQKDIQVYFSHKRQFNEQIDRFLNPKQYEEIERQNPKNKNLKPYQLRGKIKLDALNSLLLYGQGTKKENGKTLENTIAKSLWWQSKEIYTSFLKSLEFTVARIPAQSMQSFMAMKVVGFVEENVNNCYVCDDLIWLQGSDFDIDKATFMGFAFDAYGKFVGWSPYFSLYSYEHLKASEKLPFPTNVPIDVKVSNINSFNYDRLIYDKSTNPKGIFELKKNNYVLKKDLSPEQIVTITKVLLTVNAIAEEQAKKQLGKRDALYFLYADEKHLNIAKAVKKLANRHNRVNNETLQPYLPNDIDLMLKNFIATNAFNISKDPANIPASQTSVDVAAGPLKDLGDESTFGGSTSGSRPGDVSIYWSALEFNQTGKDVIGITAANGVKVYYALSQIVNEKLSKEEWKNLKFDVLFNGKRYFFLADAFVALSKTLDPIIRRAIETNPQKADLMISGLLSLATDNAKELKLGKLNAGRDVAGLYIYGITIGVPVRELFEKLTSPTAIVLDRLMKSNIFSEDRDFNTLTSAISYLVDGPIFLGKKELFAKYRGVRPLTAKAWDTFAQEFKIDKFPKEGKEENAIEDNVPSLKDALLLNDSDSLLDTILHVVLTETLFNSYLDRFNKYKAMILNAVSNYENLNKSYGSKYTAQRIRKNLDELEEYIYIIKEISTKNGKVLAPKDIMRDLLDIITLNDGYAELASIAKRLSLNQGIKTKLEDKLLFYENFSNTVSSRKKALQRRKKLLGIMKDSKGVEEVNTLLDKILDFEKENKKVSNLPSSVLDENPDKISFSLYFDNNRGQSYKKLVNTLYDDIKQSFNVFMVTEELPHYNAYERAAYIDFSAASMSAKFRTLSEVIMPIINSIYSPTARERRNYIKRASWLLESVLINQFLREQPVIELIDKTKNIGGNSPYTTRIQLGTTEGNATFKAWMENYFIPTLKENSTFRTNSFIKDLEPAFNNQTLTRNKTLAYTLPIDMIPKSDIEKALLSKYKVAFYQLNGAEYKESSQDKEVKHDIMLLFFYYNLINYRNSSNSNALTPLFECMLDLGTNATVRKYIEFVSSFDRVNGFKIIDDTVKEKSNTPATTISKTGIHLTYDDIYRALAPDDTEITITKARNKKLPYIRFYNNVSMRFELFKFMEPDEIKKQKEAWKNLSKDSREAILEDQKVRDKEELLEKLLSDYNALSKADLKEPKGRILLNRIRALKKRRYGSEEDEIVEEVAEETSEEVNEEVGETENYEESEDQNYEENSDLFFGELELTSDDVDEGEVAETQLQGKRDYFISNYYHPLEAQLEDLIKNTPYISTLGDPIRLQKGILNFEFENISGKISHIKETNSEYIKLSGVKLKTSEKDYKVNDIIIKDLDSVTSVDFLTGERIINANELAVRVNREIDKQLKPEDKLC